MLVHTVDGLVERSELEAKDIIFEDDNSRTVATEWYLGGRLVRRDVHVSVLRGQSVFGDQAKVG
jgi:hypothetical protein